MLEVGRVHSWIPEVLATGLQTPRETNYTLFGCINWLGARLTVQSSEARGRCTVKHHYMKHWAKEAADHGNPSFYHTYADESRNRWIKRIAKAVHARRFAERVLLRLLKRQRLA